MWTDELREYFNAEAGGDDGDFWISFEDFMMNFDGVKVCKIQEWQEVRAKGKFIRVREAKYPEKDRVLSKFYYEFTLEEPTTVVIGLHQEDERIIGVESRRYYIDLSLTVFKKTDDEIDQVGNVDNILM